MKIQIAALTAVILLFAGCAVKEEKITPPKKEVTKKQPIQKSTKKPSEAITAAPTPEFFRALDLSVGYYDRLSKKNTLFNYGDQNYTAAQMRDSLLLFKKYAASMDKEALLAKLDQDFLLYESKNEKDSALLTGYYAPMLKGSLTKSDEFYAPLYPYPQDLITADLKRFPTSNSVRDIAGKIEGKSLVPYYTREEIDNGALKEKPLLYLSSKVDAFLLEVQGSGIIEVDGVKRYVGYAGKNGHPYTSIGKVIADEKLMNSDKVNMQTMKEFLEENPKIRDYILNKNKSYVFFKFNEKEGIFGNIGLSLTAKESVAMDNELLPKGALAFIKTVVPKKIEGQKVVARTEREPFEKFVMVQDTGGAIRGGGRVDIYFGEGDEALFYAGQTASKGEVYLLVAKKESLNHITK